MSFKKWKYVLFILIALMICHSGMHAVQGDLNFQYHYTTVDGHVGCILTVDAYGYDGDLVTEIEEALAPTSMTSIEQLIGLRVHGYPALASKGAGYFKDFKELMILDLSGNELAAIPYGLFEGLKNLTQLSLADNYFTSESFSPLSFQNLPKLQVINLAGNVAIRKKTLAFRNFGQPRNCCFRYDPHDDDSWWITDCLRGLMPRIDLREWLH